MNSSIGESAMMASMPYFLTLPRLRKTVSVQFRIVGRRRPVVEHGVPAGDLRLDLASCGSEGRGRTCWSFLALVPLASEPSGKKKAL